MRGRKKEREKERKNERERKNPIALSTAVRKWSLHEVQNSIYVLGLPLSDQGEIVRAPKPVEFLSGGIVQSCYFFSSTNLCRD